MSEGVHMGKGLLCLEFGVLGEMIGHIERDGWVMHVGYIDGS
jgi:hypothetical protein